MSSASVNLFTTIDSRWLPYACMMIRSVRANCAGLLRYWIIHEDIAADVQALVRSWGEREGIDIGFVDFAQRARADLTGRLAGLESRLPGCSRGVYWGRYCGRFLLPNDVRRAIFADVDMVATGDMMPLAELDLEGRTVGAVEYLSAGAAEAIGLEGEASFNNGLLVFDLDQFDLDGCIQRMNAALDAEDLPFGPQSAFNHAMRGQIFRIDEQWNVQGNLRLQVGGHARLVHFTGDTKPWHVLSTDPLRPLVKSMIESTPFPEAWEPDTSLAKRARLMARTCRNVVKRIARSNA